MARIKMVRLVEEPVFLQSASIEAGEKVEIASEGDNIHVRFLPGHQLHGRIGHVVFRQWQYAILDDAEAKPKDAKK